MLELVHHLRVRTKFAVLAGVALLTLAVPTALLIRAEWAAIDRIAAERAALPPLAASRDLLV